MRFLPLLLLPLLFVSCIPEDTVRSTPATGDAVEGMASYYADRFEGRPTASGEPYRGDSLTAAHRNLPFGTRLRVTHLASGRSVLVRVNDRGPWKEERVVDLSRAAAATLGMIREGVARVRVERVQ